MIWGKQINNFLFLNEVNSENFKFFYLKHRPILNGRMREDMIYLIISSGDSTTFFLSTI